MVDSRDEDDLFQHTSMTFGQHLDELRSALFKSVIALFIGFCVGLYFGTDVVRFIQKPVEDAMYKFYTQEAKEYLDKHLAHLPPEMRGDPAIQKRLLEEGFAPEQYFLERQLLHRLQGNSKTPATVDLPAPNLNADTKSNDAKSSGADSKDAVTNANDGDGKAENAVAPVRDALEPIILWHPLSEDERLKVESFAMQEGMMVWLKAGFLLGAILASPFVFYFLWSFVAAGLYPHEKKYIHMFLPFSILLFLAGAGLAFSFVFPPVLEFFLSFSKAMNQEVSPRISEWLNFVLLMPLAFGVSFQLPLLMLALERVGIVGVDTYVGKWRIAVLLMAVAAMVLTPSQDPYSMLMLLVPLIGLYFLGIGLCRWMPASPGRPASPSGKQEYAGAK